MKRKEKSHEKHSFIGKNRENEFVDKQLEVWRNYQNSLLSSNQQLVLLQERISRYLKIVWRWPLADPSRYVIVRTMAWAKPTSKVTSIWQGDTPQMGAYSNHHKPFRVLNSSRIILGVPKGGKVNTVGQLDVVLSSTSDENRLTTPLDCNSGPWFDAGEVYLNGGKGKYIFACRHAQDKLQHQETDQGSVHKPSTGQDKVGKCSLAGIAWGITLMIVVVIHNF
ncbi:hypothetical protein RHGRI_033184 [Rhododendron griersonianum]|uniref:Uncharacterized protein n=1 Tax=Rhododendron griersonianum TaxID=479676 RepID=A0AAV6I1G3_9ERIC|nr:hypothetical protein RHGRI_033184 [Rhododendron griersonianum]